MKALTAEQRKERLKVYRGMLAEWEFSTSQLDEARAGELDKDIRDLRLHIGLLESAIPQRKAKSKT
jgi:hypothetical protein